MNTHFSFSYSVARWVVTTSLLVGCSSGAEQENDSEAAAVVSGVTMNVSCSDGSKKELPQTATQEEIDKACQDPAVDPINPASCPAAPLAASLATRFANGVSSFFFAKNATIALYERPVNAAGKGPWKRSERTIGWLGFSDNLEQPAELLLTLANTKPDVRIHFIQSGIRYHVDNGLVWQSGEETRSSSSGRIAVQNCDVLADGTISCEHGTTMKSVNPGNGVRFDPGGARGWTGTVGTNCARMAMTEMSNDRATERMFVILSRTP